MIDKTIAFLLVGVLVGAAAGVGVGYFVWNDSGDTGYDSGFEAGKKAGFENGYNAGFEDGYEEGYDAGTENGAGYETYWYYIDFGGEPSDYESKWISAKSYSVLTGLTAALDLAEIPYTISATGWISSIGGVGTTGWGPSDYLTDSNIEFGTSWMSWFWSSTNMTSWSAWRETPGLDVTLGTIFYVGFTMAYYDEDNFTTWCDLEPASMSGTGPFNGSTGNNVSDVIQTYHFYIDFGDGTTTCENGWISADGYSVLEALLAALDEEGITYTISSTGWISSIGGVSTTGWGPSDYMPDSNIEFGTSWMSWFWSSTNAYSWSAWRETPGLDVTLGTILYIGYTTAYYDEDNFTTWCDLDPNESGVTIP